VVVAMPRLDKNAAARLSDQESHDTKSPSPMTSMLQGIVRIYRFLSVDLVKKRGSVAEG
jgi:hypothetical protein